MLKFGELCVNLHPKLDKTTSMKQIKTLGTLLALLISMAACTTTDDTEVTLYSDAAITTFTLGTMNLYTTTTADDGTTTTSKTTYTGSSYPFVIEQLAQTDEEGNLRRLIYNNDSLPKGTDYAHVICTISTSNNGIAVIESLEEEGSYYYYSSTDSIDFSSPRHVRVFSSDGNGYSDYTIKVNVHKQNGDEFVWQQMTGISLPEAATLPAGIKQLLGGCTTEQYALSDDNKLMMSRDNGTTWTQDVTDTDEDADKLPTEDVALVSYPMNLADKTDYVLMAGTYQVTDNGETQNRSAVWRKIVDYGNSATAGKWTYLETNNAFTLPCLTHLNLIKYDDAILAFGGDYSTIYQSRDNGITWKKSTLYTMPADFDYSTTGVTVAVDDDQYIWLYCAGTNQVWRGRLNRLGWAY